MHANTTVREATWIRYDREKKGDQTDLWSIFQCVCVCVCVCAGAVQLLLLLIDRPTDRWIRPLLAPSMLFAKLQLLLLLLFPPWASPTPPTQPSRSDQQPTDRPDRPTQLLSTRPDEKKAKQSAWEEAKSKN
ncbi:hypothetical protein BC567DRAFT_70017 [Phyllosticta citribraziliensis]